jgi:hypothetical protein
MSNQLATKTNESAKESISRTGAPVDSEPAQQPELPPGDPYKPYTEETTSPEPYRPYAEKPALSEPPYEPYKGM